MKKIIRILIILTMGVLSLSIFSGCFAKKYPVDYCGSKDLFENAKEEYRAGEEVILYFPMIATDTDYSFYLDDEPINFGYDDKHGFVIRFTMPEHGVKVSWDSRNTMEYIPELDMLIDYYSATVATIGGDEYHEFVLSADQYRLYAVLEEYAGGEDGTETYVRYIVPGNVIDECYELIDSLGLRDWNGDDTGSGITGAIISCTFMDEDVRVRVSTEHMPEDGKEKLESIGALLAGYAKEENISN